jgi:putative transposase
MKRKRHTPEEIVLRLREVERAEAEGQSVAQVCKTLGVSEQTLLRWRKQYGGMAQPEVKRLRELERENERLKKLVAEQALDISMLKEISTGNF